MQMKIGQKTSPARDKLSKIENSDKHDKHTIKFMAASRKKRVVILVYWFDLYYVMLKIKNNTNVYNSKNRGPWFLTKIWPPLRVKPRCLKEKNKKYKLKVTMNKKIGKIMSVTCFKEYKQVFYTIPNMNETWVIKPFIIVLFHTLRHW